MAISKIILNGVTQMDVTQDTVAAANLLLNETATGADGQPVVGAYVPASPTLQTKSVSYTPTESQQTATVTASTGYDGLEEVDITVGAISSSYVGSAIDRRDSTDLSASGATVTAPAGYYASAATKSVASGTAGTPSATKGAVSNHSVSVTPSVTNTAGYISGGTISGTAVTVDVTELESGTKSITENGTGISVSGYSAVDVNVSGGGGNEDAILQRELTGSYTNSTITTLSNALTYQTQVTSISLPNLTRGLVNEMFRGCSNLTSLYVPNLSSAVGNANYGFAETKLINFAMPGWTAGIGNRLFNNCSSLEVVDMAVSGFGGDVFYGCQNLNTLILRRTASLVTISNTTFGSSPFASGGTGGTIYIPKVFYDALGTGTNDYKSASNWSTIDGYGTITWAKIEGSYYETHYADGTTVPSA